MDRRTAFLGVAVSEILPLLVVCHKRTRLLEQLISNSDSFDVLLRNEVRKNRRGFARAVVMCTRRGLGPRLHSFLAQKDCLRTLDQDISRALRELKRIYEVLAACQWSVAQQFLNVCRERGLQSIMFKSFNLCPKRRQSAIPGVNYDVDFVIRKKNYPAVERTLAEMGFRQGTFRNGKILENRALRRHDLSSDHYEWWPFLSAGPQFHVDSEIAQFLELCWPVVPGEMRRQQVNTFVAFDIHHGIDMHIPATELWNRVHQVNGQELVADGFVLWFLCARLYTETFSMGSQNFRMLSAILDLVRFGEINWDDFIVLSDRYGTIACSYYVLNAVRQIMGTRVCSNTLKSLNRRMEGRHNSRNFGPLLPRLLGLADLQISLGVRA